LPLEQNNGNTNCTDPIFENFTNIKTQLYPTFNTGTKNLCMQATPKVMPPIYFHGNYNRYKEHNNTI